MEAFLLSDRITKIQSINEQYDLEHNAYISYSAGKDSNILSALVDLALPGNNIPRVYIDTGIELNAVRQFERERERDDPRFIHILPGHNIRTILVNYGYPFKSKEHSCKLNSLKNGSTAPSILKYWRLGEWENVPNKYGVPKALVFQRSPDYALHISDACCYKLKKEPIKAWEKETGRYIGILGLRQAEGGQRRNKTNCVAFDGDKLHHFSPLLPMDDSWCEWFIQEYKIALPSVYYPPYNFKRTGCKGCPYNTNLQSDLETLKKFFPAEAKQCENIWQPIYEEYRRIGYRLNVYKSKDVQYELQFDS